MSDGFTYFHGRPLFPSTVNWQERPGRAILADARTHQIGFGAEVVEPLQEFTAEDFQLTVRLADACAVNEFERFFARTYGPLRGFWLPGLESAADMLGAPNANSILIGPGSFLATHAADERWHYLLLVPPADSGLAPVPLKLTSVVADPAGSGNFVASITPSMPLVPTAAWSVKRLHYVRLATNDIKLTFWGDNRAEAQLRLVELPPEYTAIELGERPAYLYTFTRAAGEIVPAKTWYRTSFGQPLSIGGMAYLPAPITHSRLQRSLKGDRDGISLEGWLDGADNPLALYLPFPPQLKVRLSIDAVRLDALAGEIADVSTAPERIFSGEISSVVPRGRKLEATCLSQVDAFHAQMPRFLIQKGCGHQLYCPTTCRVPKALYRVTGTVTNLDANNVLVQITGGTADRADHWFAQGWIVLCTGADEEYRSIAESVRVSANTQLLRMNSRFSLAAAVGQQFVAYAGCDLQAITCGTKFNNFVNFGGHPQLVNDLGLKAINLKSNAGGKGGGGK